MSSSRLIAAVVIVLLTSFAACAGVIVTVEHRDNVVQGTSAGALMVSLNTHPVAGDGGRAYASTHPEFSLDIRTAEKGGMCRARVDVRVAFTMTLPRAASAGRMSASVRRAWNAFTAFTRTHEAHHQASYIACAKDFVAAAERKSGRQCTALSSEIGRMFTRMQADCELEQEAFDREQRPIVGHMDLFMLAQLDLLN